MCQSNFLSDRKPWWLR